MITLWGRNNSTNVKKVLWVLEELALPHEQIVAGLHHGVNDTPEYLAMNPNGRIPLLEIEPGIYLPESNAILWYLAEGSQYVPDEPLARARMLQWMFFEQYSHEPYIATVRYWIHMLDQEAEYRAEIERRRGPGYAALDVMEGELSVREFFAGAFSIADIALYAYTHVAHEGGFNLDNYPAIRAWIQRIEAIPGYVPLA